MTDQQQPKPWEQQSQSGETARQYEAFCVYRDAGPGRSLARVARDTGLRSSRRIERWSAAHDWPARVGAWHLERDRVKRDAELEELRAMGKRQAQEAQAVAAGLVSPVRMLLRRLQEDPEAAEREMRAMPLPELVKLNARCATALAAIHGAERAARVNKPLEEKQDDPNALAKAGPERIELVLEAWPDHSPNE